jgi:hypothetical protein
MVVSFDTRELETKGFIDGLSSRDIIEAFDD